MQETPAQIPWYQNIALLEKSADPELGSIPDTDEIPLALFANSESFTPGHLPPDRASQARLPYVSGRLKEIAGQPEQPPTHENINPPLLIRTNRTNGTNRTDRTVFITHEPLEQCTPKPALTAKQPLPAEPPLQSLQLHGMERMH